jgi:hypothetical protein
VYSLQGDSITKKRLYRRQIVAEKTTITISIAPTAAVALGATVVIVMVARIAGSEGTGDAAQQQRTATARAVIINTSHRPPVVQQDLATLITLLVQPPLLASSITVPTAPPRAGVHTLAEPPWRP